MPVRCHKVLVHHQMHIPATTATLLQVSPHSKLFIILNFIANGLAEMGLKILHLHLLLRHMHWLAEKHTTAFHQLVIQLPGDCSDSSGFPHWSQLLKPRTRDPDSWLLLANTECNTGWVIIAATPVGTEAHSDFHQ